MADRPIRAAAQDLARHARPAPSHAFWLVALALTLLTIGTNLPTALYSVYRAQYGFSSGVLTLIFAVYALVLIPALVVFGQLSDRIGRRPLIVGGLVLAAAGAGLFAAATGTGWLFAARVLQGLGVGAASGAATAALTELQPAGDRSRGSVVATVALSGGGALGPLIAGLIGQYGPAPTRLSFILAIAGLLALAVVLLLRLPEPVSAEQTATWRPRWPHVPASIRRPFARAALGAFVAWAVVGLFFSVVPSYTGSLLSSTNLALLALGPFLLLGVSCAFQLAAGSLGARPARVSGLLLLAAGLALTVASFPTHLLVLLVAATVVAGGGQGLAFVGALAEVNLLAPPERRAEVVSSLYVIVYLAVGIPVVGVGYLAGATSLFAAVAVFAALFAAIALTGAALSLRSA